MPTVKKKYRLLLNEVRGILESLNFPEKQNNDLTAWAVLALNDDSPLETKAGFSSLAKGSGIRDVLDYCRKCGTKYAENTRESLRKYSVKYLVNHGVMIRNHDDPGRATNSSRTNYILTPEFREILKSEEKEQRKLIEAWLKKHGKNGNKKNWRKDKSLLISFNGHKYKVHPSLHNYLEKAAIEVFIPSLSKSAEIIYFSDTDDKSLHVDEKLEDFLGSKFDVHKKLPDVVAVSYVNKEIYFIEAVASAGEINQLRKVEIEKLFTNVEKDYCWRFVSVFQNRKDFRKFSDSIAINSEAWILEDKEHIISVTPLK